MRDAEAAVAAANRGYQFTDAIARHAGPVRAMGMEDALSIRWHADRDTMVRRQGEGSDRNAVAAALIRVLRLGLQGAMIGVGGWLAIRGDLLPVSIFAASLLLGRALAPLEVAVGGWRQIVNAIEAGRRVQKALVMAPARAVAGQAAATATSRSSAQKRRLRPARRRRGPALKDIDLHHPRRRGGRHRRARRAPANPASRGCSPRSPLRPRAGSPIGGIEGRLWTAEDLARYVGYLPQSVGLFPGTIRDNIARFTDADDDEVVKAARRANVHEMILELPDGYETQDRRGRHRPIRRPAPAHRARPRDVRLAPPARPRRAQCPSRCRRRGGAGRRARDAEARGLDHRPHRPSPRSDPVRRPGHRALQGRAPARRSARPGVPQGQDRDRPLGRARAAWKPRHEARFPPLRRRPGLAAALDRAADAPARSAAARRRPAA